MSFLMFVTYIYSGDYYAN